jgi:hypothetical protein
LLTATAGTDFRVQFFCFCNYVIDIFFVMAPSGPVPFTDSRVGFLRQFFGRAVILLFFRISAVLWAYFLFFLRLVAMGQLLFFFLSKETPLGCSSAMTVPTGTFVPS